MIRNVALLILITLVPIFEVRASVPVGIMSGTLNLPLGISMSGLGLRWWVVWIICVSANILLGVVFYPLIEHIILLFERIPFFGRFWKTSVMHVQKRIHPYVERWGRLGIALYVGTPLPGCGTYSAALGAYLLGMSYRSFILANALGAVIAGSAVTAVVLTGSQLFRWAISV